MGTKILALLHLESRNCSAEMTSGIVGKEALDTLIDRQQFDLELQDGIGRDSGHRLRAIGQIGWDFDATLAANRHADHTNVPAFDHFTGTDGEGEGRALFVGWHE